MQEGILASQPHGTALPFGCAVVSPVQSSIKCSSMTRIFLSVPLNTFHQGCIGAFLILVLISILQTFSEVYLTSLARITTLNRYSNPEISSPEVNQPFIPLFSTLTLALLAAYPAVNKSTDAIVNKKLIFEALRHLFFFEVCSNGFPYVSI